MTEREAEEVSHMAAPRRWDTIPAAQLVAVENGVTKTKFTHVDDKPYSPSTGPCRSFLGTLRPQTKCHRGCTVGSHRISIGQPPPAAAERSGMAVLMAKCERFRQAYSDYKASGEKAKRLLVAHK